MHHGTVITFYQCIMWLLLVIFTNHIVLFEQQKQEDALTLKGLTLLCL